MKSNIEGFPGYHISRDGKIYSCKLGAWIEKATFVLNSRKGRNGGYKYTVLNNSGKQYALPISRLVALTYIPNPKGYPIVCHKNNDRLDNRVENLYWGTQSMNQLQIAKEGCSTRKYNLTKTQYLRMVRLYKRGWNKNKLAVKFGISYGAVTRWLKHGKSYLNI